MFGFIFAFCFQLAFAADVERLRYAPLSPFSGSVTVPGEGPVSLGRNLEAYFLENYPEFEDDRIGLKALVRHLAELAEADGGVINRELINASVIRYGIYAKVGGFFDRLEADERFVGAQKVYFARRIIEESDPSVSVADLEERYAGLVGELVYAEVLPGDTPDTLMERLRAGFGTWTGTGKRALLERVLPFNTGLVRESDGPLMGGLPVMPIAGRTGLRYGDERSGFRVAYYRVEVGSVIAVPRAFLSGENDEG